VTVSAVRPLALSATLICAAVLAANPPDPPVANAPKATAADVAEAVRQLGSTRFPVREKAQQTLWRAGTAAEPALRKALEDADPEVVRRAPVPTYAFWSLTRVGARVLLYGPLNAVLHPVTVGPWLDALVGFQPGHQSEMRDWAFCLAQLARKTGQRALDIDDGRRTAVLAVLRGLDIPPAWPRMVEEVVMPEGADQAQLFGESLPIGLRLAGA
jgi:hypothetical protein